MLYYYTFQRSQYFVFPPKIQNIIGQELIRLDLLHNSNHTLYLEVNDKLCNIKPLCIVLLNVI